VYPARAIHAATGHPKSRRGGPPLFVIMTLPLLGQQQSHDHEPEAARSGCRALQDGQAMIVNGTQTLVV